MRRWIIIVGSLLLLFMVGGSIYALAFKKAPILSNLSLTVRYNTLSSTTITLYHAVSDGTPHPTELSGSPIAKLQTGVKIPISSGPYIVTVSGDDIASQSIGFVVGSSSVVLPIDVSLSPARLAALTPDATQAVNRLLYVTYPTIASLYTINMGTLYGAGDWYSTTLTYKGTVAEQRDSLRTIAQKVNGQWNIVAPPSINLDTTTYPTIPRYILSAADKPISLPSIGGSPGVIAN